MRRMTATITLVLSVGWLSGARLAAAGPEAGASPLRIFYTAEEAHQVTVESRGGTVAVLDFPAGVLLGLAILASGNPPMPDALALPNTFRGDIEILARRQDEVAPDEATGAREIMAKGPVLVRLTDVVVHVKTVGAEQPAG